MPRPKKFEEDKLLTVRIEKEQLDQAKLKAAKEGKSLSQAVREWLSKWTGEDPPKN